MTQKFNYQGYTICVTFRSENSLSLTASYNLTGEHFINDMVELGKIKKDTVIATLSRKSEKNLWCTFKMVDSQPRKLIVSFIVHFDYLPEFSEDVTLEYLQVKGEVLNKISSVQLQSDINQIEKVLDAIKNNGAIQVSQKNSSLGNNKYTQMMEYELNQGRYLLQISGVITNATSVGDTIEFMIKDNGAEDKKTIKQKSHTQHGYGYPYFITEVIQTKGGKLQILAKNGNSSTASISSQIITLIPIIGHA